MICLKWQRIVQSLKRASKDSLNATYIFYLILPLVKTIEKEINGSKCVPTQIKM